MGTQKIRLRIETVEAEGRAPLLHASLEIGGHPVGAQHTLDWQELFRSLKGTGEFFMWTAPSGEPLEAAIHDCCISRYAGDIINWEWLDPISLNQLAPDDPRELQTASFSAKQYEEALWQGWWLACKLLRGDPHLVVHPLTLGVPGLLGLDRWFKTDDAQPFSPSYRSLPAPE